MPIARVIDTAYVRFAAPDLAAMRAFLDDFGFAVDADETGRLWARGAGPGAFLHATEPGEPRFVALGLQAAGMADLEALAASDGASIEALDAPGGGAVVRLSDPDGFLIEVVAGQAPAEPKPLPSRPPVNAAVGYGRLRQSVRLTPGAACVVRLGHCVLEVSDFRRSQAWYKARFGFLTSDEIRPAPDFAIGGFLRCDRGETPTDHHTVFLLQSPRGPRFHHAAFEVTDFDDLMRGHSHLKLRGRKPVWGVGRHLLGSQIFDYWADPWGHDLEHWTDGDLFTAADGEHVRPLEDLLAVQWGPSFPMSAGAGASA